MLSAFIRGFPASSGRAFSLFAVFFRATDMALYERGVRVPLENVSVEF